MHEHDAVIAAVGIIKNMNPHGFQRESLQDIQKLE